MSTPFLVFPLYLYGLKTPTSFVEILCPIILNNGFEFVRLKVTVQYIGGTWSEGERVNVRVCWEWRKDQYRYLYVFVYGGYRLQG